MIIIGYLPVEPYPPWVLIDEHGHFVKDRSGKTLRFKTPKAAEAAAKELNDGMH